MRVLHVTEAMGGGIVTSLLAMVGSTPEVDHHLIATARPQHETGDGWRERFASSAELPRRLVGGVTALRRRVRELYPDVVHAHSSYAGVMARLAGLDRTKIAYSPHCFAFERRDISGSQRRAFELVERMLARRTDLFVAVAPHEIDLALGLGHEQVAYVPNRSVLAVNRVAGHALPLRVLTTGRVSAQKDWRYFLHVKQYAEQQLGLVAQWQWIGGGDAEGERALRAAGVEVSGWLPREAVLTEMGRAQVYLHTAAWEAAPISILEAAALGLPLAVRAIPPLQSLRLPGLAGSVTELAEALTALRSPEHWANAQVASRALADRHSSRIQGRELQRAYAQVLASAPHPEPASPWVPSPVPSARSAS
ncbi:glycosyltransferase [Nocardioides massiliensis]|uniref:Glycosyltransferase involved in cell wall biosynthesis n=1 Tax=Nocardioides massiliensis TaxID=1325935 RepID=A0ABT9NM97_9ACTN|nr:glycosyltransferase [Nocardioides massiliensis]MDP9821548.1 glycosyltransferase involved in cell wall biosynthesis [Nocardioides massiliensis]